MGALACFIIGFKLFYLACPVSFAGLAGVAVKRLEADSRKQYKATEQSRQPYLPDKRLTTNHFKAVLNEI